MRSKRVIVVFGTRPEAVKMAPVIKALEMDDRFEPIVCVTGQHREMLDQTLEKFDIVPHHDLDIMKTNQSLHGIAGTILSELQPIFESEAPDVVLVQGDTTTTLAGSLAGYYAKIPVGHIEAGLRTGNIYSPWPEEGNRRLTSGIATFHFAPTEGSRQNLLREGIADGAVHVTGNTVIDALFLAIKRIATDSELQAYVASEFDFLDDARRMILITAHRRESFGGGIERICDAVSRISDLYPEAQILFPVHLNPNVKGPVHSRLSSLPNVHLVPPLDYLPFIYMMQRSYLILTDSGGVQEEAPSLGKPVLVMRDTTERPEAVEAGTVRLVGTDVEKIAENVRALMSGDGYATMQAAHNPYGDGMASARILDVLAG